MISFSIAYFELIYIDEYDYFLCLVLVTVSMSVFTSPKMIKRRLSDPTDKLKRITDYAQLTASIKSNGITPTPLKSWVSCGSLVTLSFYASLY